MWSIWSPPPPFLSFLEGMVIHNIERHRDFTHLRSEVYGLQLQGTRWPLVTNYQVIIPARLMSEVSVITPRQETSCGWSCRVVLEIFNPRALQNLIVEFILPLQKKIKKINKSPFCCLLRSASPSSYGVHKLFLTRGCNCKPRRTDVPIEGFLLLHTWAILPSWNQTQNLSLSPL